MEKIDGFPKREHKTNLKTCLHSSRAFGMNLCILNSIIELRRFGKLGAWLLVCLTTTVASTAAGPDPWSTWVEGTSLHDGATRDYYNRAAGLRWTRKMGDWVDADGTLHGNLAFDTADWGKLEPSEKLSVPVTRLVHEWLLNVRPNNGIMLRVVGGKGTIRLHSRDQSNSFLSPRLTMQFDSGEVVSYAQSDAHLRRGTYRGSGDEPALVLSSQQHGAGAIRSPRSSIHWEPD